MISTRFPGSPLTIRSLSTLITSRHLDLVILIETKFPTIFSWFERSVFAHHFRKKDEHFWLLNPWKALDSVLSRPVLEFWSFWKGSPTCTTFSCCQGSASQVENFPHTTDGRTQSQEKRQCWKYVAKLISKVFEGNAQESSSFHTFWLVCHHCRRRHLKWLFSYFKVKRPMLCGEPDNWLWTPTATCLPKPWFWRKIGLLFSLHANILLPFPFLMQMTWS